MKIIAVIPARFNSTRFPGKPLVDLCGKPMIWWVYNNVIKSKKISDVYVATDDERIAKACEAHGMNFIMTSDKHITSTDRLHEVAQNIDADLYICINGDEPLMQCESIEKILPVEPINHEEIYVANLACKIGSPAEAIDFTNIKVVMDASGKALFMSRSPIPYPKSSLNFEYFKHIGVLIYNKKALEFFANTPRGYNEKIEDVNELRFIENGIALNIIKIDEYETVSVDTPKDVDKVTDIIKQTRIQTI